MTMNWHARFSWVCDSLTFSTPLLPNENVTADLLEAFNFNNLCFQYQFSPTPSPLTSGYQNYTVTSSPISFTVSTLTPSPSITFILFTPTPIPVPPTCSSNGVSSQVQSFDCPTASPSTITLTFSSTNISLVQCFDQPTRVSSVYDYDGFWVFR